MPTLELALRDKASLFSPALLVSLKKDIRAQAKSAGEIVGIDWDPFVGGQDPSEHYTVRKVAIRGNRCFAEVWRDSPTDTTETSQKPDVVAELMRRRGHWMFTNFRYPDVGGNLMEALAELRKSRTQPLSKHSSR